MANTASAIKRTRQATRKTDVNRRNQSQLRTQVKKLGQALAAKDMDSAEKLLSPTMSLVDRSVQKGVLKKNSASRMKSRLTVRLNTLKTAEAPAKS